jgi:hypothetical protein
VNDYLDFLKFCIDDKAKKPYCLKTIDWDGLMQFAEKQSIVGVVFHGINRLEVGDPRPEKRKIIEWLSYYNTIKAENETLNRDSARLTYMLYKKGGMKSCVLKGQGNALMYPDPYMRMSGDVDLWTDQDDIKMLAFVKKMIPEAGIEYHHVDFPVLEQTPAEIHMMPSFMGNLFYERRLRRYFRNVRDEQFKNIVSLPDGAGRICVPTDSFNRVFQMSHMMHHFFFEGLGLRQMIDYYYLLKKGCPEEQRREDWKTIKHLSMRKFTQGMMWIMKDTFGLEDGLLLAKPNEKIGRLLLNEALEAGKFGHHETRYAFKGKSVYTQYFVEIWRNLHFAWLFPSETIFGRPIARWWHLIYKRILRKKVARAISETKN